MSFDDILVKTHFVLCAQIHHFEASLRKFLCRSA
jgi:hypothetical protein